jgi:hypothetical protein
VHLISLRQATEIHGPGGEEEREDVQHGNHGQHDPGVHGVEASTHPNHPCHIHIQLPYRGSPLVTLYPLYCLPSIRPPSHLPNLKTGLRLDERPTTCPRTHNLNNNEIMNMYKILYQKSHIQRLKENKLSYYAHSSF